MKSVEYKFPSLKDLSVPVSGILFCTSTSGDLSFAFWLQPLHSDSSEDGRESSNNIGATQALSRFSDSEHPSQHSSITVDLHRGLVPEVFNSELQFRLPRHLVLEESRRRNCVEGFSSINVWENLYIECLSILCAKACTSTKCALRDVTKRYLPSRPCVVEENSDTEWKTST